MVERIADIGLWSNTATIGTRNTTRGLHHCLPRNYREWLKLSTTARSTTTSRWPCFSMGGSKWGASVHATRVDSCKSRHDDHDRV